MVPAYRRPMFDTLWQRLHEPRRTIQVLAGPRQTGKTTIALQVQAAFDRPVHRASADMPGLQPQAWIREQWDVARLPARQAMQAGGGVLILDEVQKVAGWSEVVKHLWDEDTASGQPLHVVLLGSSPWQMQRGLTESLAGRFELIRTPHWGLREMRDAFGWTVDEFVYFGGYPGAAPLIDDEERWRHYVADSLIETTVSRDVLLLTRIEKPALLRRLLVLACAYSGQILSYNKMLGQLQDAGNTTTLAHYLDLLGAAGMVTGLAKYSGAEVRRRGSSPKLQVLNTALMAAQSGRSFAAARADRAFWGRLVESAVGAHLLGGASGGDIGVYYWRDGNREVDFVIRGGDSVTAIEVKSGRSRDTMPGMAAFAERFAPDRTLLVGEGGLPIEELLLMPVGDLLA